MTNYDIDGDECPMGYECAIHYRNSEDTVGIPGLMPRLINYVGDYAIVTDEATDTLRRLFGPRYDTIVVKVGEGSLSGAYELPDAELEARVAFTQTHNDPVNFREAHAMVMEGVSSGRLELDA